MNVSRIVCPRRWRDLAIVEKPLLNGQGLVGARRHEHDVDQALLDDLYDLFTKVLQASVWQVRRPRLERASRGTDGEGHVSVLGIGQDEFLGARRVRMNAG